jgi:DNA-directed RNA polymerase subunit RPC12/RpoP
MGSKRRKSQDRLSQRELVGPDDRDTLLPCEACGAQGQIIVEQDGRYAGIKCRWCDGKTLVEPVMVAMWRRWLRIVAANPDCVTK